jgi:hypothetical protein
MISEDRIGGTSLDTVPRSSQAQCTTQQHRAVCVFCVRARAQAMDMLQTALGAMVAKTNEFLRATNLSSDSACLWGEGH